MKTHVSILALSLISALNLKAQTVSTTTISGSLRVNDSLRVLNSITSTGDITSSGEIVARDTMRAQKDVLVDGNAQIGTNLLVSGNTELNTLRVNGNLFLQNPLPAAVNPCISLLVGIPALNGGQQIAALSPADALGLEAQIEANPCPTPPVIPFAWQTYGNHVNTNNRWIGTIENYDFNIKTNNTFQLVCKANGDIGLGAFGGTTYHTNGKKYRLFVASNGEISAGIQDASGKYPFVVKPNGATSIGIPNSTAPINSYMLQVGGAVNIGDPFPANSAYLLTVNGRIGAREIKVSIQNLWPDYVFEKGYAPKSLEAVEAYIAEHKHLPGIPDAKSLENETCGLDIGNMQALQMEKIEEIYLHLIELSKEVKELKKENAILRRTLRE